jgi:hypothetical protein
MKRILNVKKSSRTTALLHAVNIEPTDYRLDFGKVRFFERIVSNEATRMVISGNIDEYNKTRSNKSVSNRTLGEIMDKIRKWETETTQNEQTTNENVNISWLIDKIKLTREKLYSKWTAE